MRMIWLALCAWLFSVPVLLTGCSMFVSEAKLTAEQVLKKSASVYLESQSYYDTGEVDTVFIEGQSRRECRKTFTTAFRRPDAFRFELKDNLVSYIIWRNGKTVSSWWDMEPMIKTDTSLASAIAASAGVCGDVTYVIPKALMPQEIDANALFDGQGAQCLSDGEIADHSCYRIQVKDKTTLWIGKKDFLLRRIETSRQIRNFRAETVINYHPAIGVMVPLDLLAFDLPASADSAYSVVVTDPPLASIAVELLQSGQLLTGEQAEQIQRQLTGTERDILDYTRLLGYYHEHANNRIGHAKRMEIVLFLIEKYPQSEVLSGSAGEVYPLQPQIDKARGLWQEHLRKNPRNAQLFWNAACNMSMADPDFALDCLSRGEALAPDNYDWDWQKELICGMLHDRKINMTTFFKEIRDWIALEGCLVEKNNLDDAVGVVIRDFNEYVSFDKRSTIRWMRTQSVGNVLQDEEFVVNVAPVIEKGVFSLRGQIQISTGDIKAGKGTVVARKEFDVSLKIVGVPIQLPPLQYKGKWFEYYIKVRHVPARYFFIPGRIY